MRKADNVPASMFVTTHNKSDTPSLHGEQMVVSPDATMSPSWVWDGSAGPDSYLEDIGSHTDNKGLWLQQLHEPNMRWVFSMNLDAEVFVELQGIGDILLPVGAMIGHPQHQGHSLAWREPAVWSSVRHSATQRGWMSTEELERTNQGALYDVNCGALRHQWVVGEFVTYTATRYEWGVGIDVPIMLYMTTKDELATVVASMELIMATPSLETPTTIHSRRAWQCGPRYDYGRKGVYGYNPLPQGLQKLQWHWLFPWNFIWEQAIWNRYDRDAKYLKCIKRAKHG